MADNLDDPPDPPWRLAFDDIMAAASLMFEESQRADIQARIHDRLSIEALGEDDPRVSSKAWAEHAERAREQARVLNRAAAILDWVGRRADRLHLLTKPQDRGRR